MLQFNKINKLKIILLSLCTVLSVSLFAQSEKTIKEGTIVMTKDELNSFLTTVANARRSQLKERENKRLKENLFDLRSKYYVLSKMDNRESSRYVDTSNEQILRELLYLNQRIDNLYSNNNMLPSNNRGNSTIIIPNSPNTNPVYREKDRNTITVIPKNKGENKNVNDDKIKELQNMIDSLKNAGAKTAIMNKENSFADSLYARKTKQSDLERQMDSLMLKLKNTENSEKTKEPTEINSYFMQQVYFDNNSEKLIANYFTQIQDLTHILIKYPKAKILLEGWASPLGKVNYNKQLSMRRAESVERAFINNGIDANRIITSFRGEDKSSSEQEARRVDMSIVLR